MSDPLKLYWDSSCFICLLNPNEPERAVICKDILKNGELGNVKIYTSIWTVVEVVRPKRPGVDPLPAWAGDAINAIEKEHPNVRQEMEMLWRRHQSDTLLPKLTPDQIAKIEGMFFGWPYITMIRVDKQVARRAVELQRDYNLKAADSIHVASALSVKHLSEFHAWDRGFGKVSHLITVSEPRFLTPEGPLTKRIEELEHEQSEQTVEPLAPELRGSVGDNLESKAGPDTPEPDFTEGEQSRGEEETEQTKAASEGGLSENGS